MPAAIDTTDGQSAFVSAHTGAWHQLGTTLNHSFTAEEAMKEGLLGGWDVRKLPLTATTPDGIELPIPDRMAVVRTNPVRRHQTDVLGTVGTDYQIIQNEAHADLLNALVDESGAHFETAGALGNGSRVFITMKLPSHINVGGVDPVENYIAAINSHDGSMSFTLMVTPVRIVCANTLNLAFSSYSHLVRIRHTSGAEAAVRRQAREALDMSFNYLEGFQEQAERLINTTMTQSTFEQLIEREFGAGEDAAPATVTRTERKLEEMAELFADTWTQEDIRNTAWAGLNALTEWSDHYAPTRGQNQDMDRSRKAILNPAFKNRALDLMMSQVS